MTKDAPKVDLLLEQLAPEEVELAKRALAKGGIPALLGRGRDALRAAEAARVRFEALASALEARPTDRLALVAAYLRESSRDPGRLKDDLAALQRRGDVFDLPALSERLAKDTTDAEILAEACVALARRILDEHTARASDPATLIELARVPGRWARRCEAIRLLRDLARYPMPADARMAVASAMTQLAQRTEHRWVQPAALHALAAYDSGTAFTMCMERMEKPGPGDDLLVRERLVEVASRIRRAPWARVVAAGSADPSDHVRVTAARCEPDPLRLVGIVRSDKSPKVRAAALVHLTKRSGARAEPLLVEALRGDPDGVVVRTAAELLALLARRKRMKGTAAIFDALRAAAARTNLPAEIRARVGEEAAEIDVALDPYLGVVHDLVRRLVPRIPVGGAMKVGGPVLSSLNDEQLGRVLAVLSRGDFALSADRLHDGVLIYRGEPRTFAPWRALYELRHPLPSKRQGYVHTWGRLMRGSLRAPPAGLAEITATQVPGERVLAGKSGGWGREIPLVDDLLATGVWRAKPVALVSATGTTLVVPPASFARRAAAWLRLTAGYARYVQLRRRALDSEEPAVQRSYVEEVLRATGIVVRWIPRAFGPGQIALETPSPLETPSAAAHAAPRGASVVPPAAMLLLAPTLPPDAPVPAPDVLWREFVSYALSAQGNRLPHVAAYASAVLAAMLARAVLVKRAIDRDRRAVPLVLGGWGTRGKSGTERLKAGLIQGLGYESLVKTTGCEAMFIHALPGVTAREVFIYRPYDKATVWEQRGLLRLARRLSVRAFLWECMALQPDLVNLLQSQWMRDDYSTITNAYPDHEDVQGPAGYDVAEVISEFVPTNGRLFTAEDQMLPILKERARARGTSIHVVSHRDSDLIADDLLARFPYHEHPRNIALVTELAQALGVPASIAIAEMADNVVPDLGVLKTYPKVTHEGRTLDFTNGMSANERTGALSNWLRMGFDKHDPDAEPGRVIVTVVNNRGDRVARSEVFARFIVEDVSAHRHVLIGTNVSGLVGFIHEALDRHVKAISPTDKLAGDPAERARTARARVERAMRFLKIPRPDAASVRAELTALKMPLLDAQLIERLLAPAQPGEPYAAAKQAVDAAIPRDYPHLERPFAIAQIARRRCARAVFLALDQHLATAPQAVEQAFADAYKAMYMEAIVPLHDATLTGDQVIEQIARAIPPGAHGSVMGIQNIKGTGLDFVYRWVSRDVVERSLKKVEDGTPEERDAGLRELLAHDDYGLLDAREAILRLRAAHGRAPAAGYDAVFTRLAEIEKRRAAALIARRADTAGDKLRKFIGKTFDYLDSIRRQRMAKDVLEDVIAGRVSHSAAAIKMREVVARAKGAWMTRR